MLGVGLSIQCGIAWSVGEYAVGPSADVLFTAKGGGGHSREGADAVERTPADGALVAAPEGVRSHALRHSRPSPRGWRW